MRASPLRAANVVTEGWSIKCLPPQGHSPGCVSYAFRVPRAAYPRPHQDGGRCESAGAEREAFSPPFNLNLDPYDAAIFYDHTIRDTSTANSQIQAVASGSEVSDCGRDPNTFAQVTRAWPHTGALRIVESGESEKPITRQAA